MQTFTLIHKYTQYFRDIQRHLHLHSHTLANTRVCCIQSFSSLCDFYLFIFFFLLFPSSNLSHYSNSNHSCTCSVFHIGCYPTRLPVSPVLFTMRVYLMCHLLLSLSLSL